MKILIVDDGDLKVAELIKRLERLSIDSANIIIANNANHAKALLRESQFAVAIRQEALVQKSTLRAALLREGLASYAEIVPSIVSLADVGAVSNPDEVLSSKPMLQVRLETFLATRTARDATLVAQQYDALLGALTALATEHQKLEAGRPVDIAIILEWVSRIRSIYDEITADELTAEN